MKQSSSKAKPIESPAKQLAGFIAKFDPAISKLVRSARSVLRKRFPTAIELIYDNYNALAIAFCTSDRTSDCMFSLAVYARGLNLYFYYGKALPDPHHILLGSGNQGRFIRLEDVATLDRPEINELLRAAVEQAMPPLPIAGRGHVVIKLVSVRQRPRRPASN